MHVVIIGAGIVGASIADSLASSGAKVTVIDQTGPGAGASGKSFGWINAAFAQKPAYFRLRRAAMDHFRQLSDEISLQHAVNWSGCLWWEEEGDDFDLHTAELCRFGYENEIIGKTAFAELEPLVAMPPERSVFSRIEGAAEGDLVAQALLARSARNGAVLVSGRKVTGLMKTQSRVIGVKTDLGALNADWVVCAAGAWSGAFLAACGVHLPMENKTGMIVHTNPAPPMVRHIIMSPDIHFRQAADGRFVMGEIFSGGFQDGVLPDAAGLANDLIARLQRRLPDCGELVCEKINLGTRPVPKDGFPVIGPATGMDGLSICVMHSGITLGPFVGRLAANEILTAAADPLLEQFRHARFV